MIGLDIRWAIVKPMRLNGGAHALTDSFLGILLSDVQADKMRAGETFHGRHWNDDSVDSGWSCGLLGCHVCKALVMRMDFG